jgi:Spy/CpxP family protein refolding chaperone
VSTSSSARTVAVITVIVSLLAGIAVGVVGDRLWLVRHPLRVGRGLRHMKERVVARLDRELSLTPQQHDAVARIVDQEQQRIAAIQNTTRPQIRHEIDLGNAEIEKLLTPEQRTKFEQMKQKVRARNNNN